MWLSYDKVLFCLLTTSFDGFGIQRATAQGPPSFLMQKTALYRNLEILFVRRRENALSIDEEVGSLKLGSNVPKLPGMVLMLENQSIDEP